MNVGKLINILLVDDHAIVREGYRALLNRQNNFNIIAEAETGEQAYSLFKEHSPTVVLLDLTLPGKSGLATLSQIRQFDHKAKVIIFTMHQNPTMAKKAVEAGARGYITKSSDPNSLVTAINNVVNGNMAISDDISRALALDNLQGQTSMMNNLSTREFEILRMIIAGRSKEEVAKTLCISSKTVANSYYIIKSKLDVKTDIELIQKTLQSGMLSPCDLMEQQPV